MEHLWKDTDRGKTEVLREKLVRFLLCPPQERTQASASETTTQYTRVSQMKTLNTSTVFINLLNIKYLWNCRTP
jgi:hypothetical protein